MGNEYEKKRRFPRIHSENLVLVTRISDGAEELGKTEQMGVGGCLFLHPDPIPEGTILELVMSVKGTLVKTRARVIYGRPEEGGLHEVGAEFLDLSEEEKSAIQSLFVSQGTVLAEG